MKTFGIPSILMIVGFLLRLLYLHEGFWLDETHVYFVAQASNISALISRMIPIEFNAPAFYILMHFWENLIGSGEVVMKIPSLIFGLLLIPVIYFLGKEVGGRTVGIITALFVTLSPQAAFYSLQCRAYALATLLYCLAVIFYCRIIGKNKLKVYPVLLSTCLLIALYVHYTSMILIVALVLSTIILWRQKEANLNIRQWTAIFLLPVIGYLPWLKITFGHMQTDSHWIYNPLWYEWIRVFFLNIIWASGISSDLEPTILYCTVFFLLLFWTIQSLRKYKDFFQSVGFESPNKLIAITICLVLPATLIEYITPHYDRYLFPFSPFEWVLFATCAVACWRYFGIGAASNQRPRKKTAMACIGLFILILACYNVQIMFIRNELPLSAARPFSRDLAYGNYANTAFVFVPDMTVCTIDYYLRHNKQLANPDALLSNIYSCPRWDDKTPYSPAEYEALFKNANLLKNIEQNISNLPLDKYPKLIFVRESGMPHTKQMPCEQTANALQAWLAKIYKLKRITGYVGRMEGYIMFVYDRG